MTTAPSRPASARQGWLARHPLVSYFLMAFAFTWALLFSVLLYGGATSFSIEYE